MTTYLKKKCRENDNVNRSTSSMVYKIASGTAFLPYIRGDPKLIFRPDP